MADVVLAASAVVVDAEGRVLLVKRGEEPEKGRWSVPGGRVDPGETLAQAAVREAFEETGLQVQIIRELWVANVPTGDGRQFEIHDFLATATGGALTPGDDAEDARWVAPHEFDSLPLTTGLAGYLERAGLTPAALAADVAQRSAARRPGGRDVCTTGVRWLYDRDTRSHSP